MNLRSMLARATGPVLALGLMVAAADSDADLRRSVAVWQPPAIVAAADAAPVPVQSGGWVFEGCWAQFAAGPCFDIYRDGSGNYWKCKACGTTGKPSSGKCRPISQATLNSGYWCS